MHDDMETKSCAHNADGHTQIAGGADLNFEFAEKFSECVGSEYAVIVAFLQHTVLQSQILRVLQYLIDPATGFNGAGNRQMAVLLQVHFAGDGGLIVFFQSFLHIGNFCQRGFELHMTLYLTNMTGEQSI